MQPSVFLRFTLATFSTALVALCPAPLLFGDEAAADGKIQLVQAGKSPYCIVLEPTASPSEKFAAEELQTHLKSCSGVELPIVVGKPQDDRPMIVLGRGPIAAALGMAPTDDLLGPQGALLRTVAPHVVIAGTAESGTLYGVHHFLERELGVRWLAPSVTTTPKQSDLSLGKIDRIVRPAFFWRHTDYTWPGGDAAFLCRRGMNDGGGDANCRFGRQYGFDGRCHSYFGFMSPDEFFETHPEYFSEINGCRVRGETQLCLTNPEVLDIVTKRMLQRMKDRPHDRQHNFSQMDWYSYCECPRCRAINEKYHTKGGTQFWFVNELAKRTAKVFPDKQIGTLAYMYTEEPPRGMTMHPNVAVWLCHMYPSCDSHPVDSCPLNSEYKRRAETWSKLCSHLYIWNYIVNYAHYYEPFPNFRAIAADMRFYQRIGVEGIYDEAMGSHGGGGEFSLLRGYYATELLKDPQQDPKAVLHDFLTGYYGPAGNLIGQYIALLQDKVERDNIHMHLYTNPAQGYLTDDVLARANAIFDEAEKAVANDFVLLERVRVARMPLVYAKLFPRNGYKIEDGRLVFRCPMGGLVDAFGFVSRIKKHGFETIREQGGDPNQMLLLAGLFNTPLPLTTIRNAHLQVDVAPWCNGRALRIVDRRTGRCVTACDTRQNLTFPFCGGEDSRVGGVFDTLMDLTCQAAVVKKTDTSVVLECRLNSGFTMRRTITLASDRPALTIRAEFTSVRDTPRETQVRSHLSLDLGDVRTTRVRFATKSGKPIDEDMTQAIAGYREGQAFLREDCPNGEWTFTGDKGPSVVQRFEKSSVGFAKLVAYPADLNELEVELWSPAVTLKPGETTRLEHELEIAPVGERAGSLSESRRN